MDNTGRYSAVAWSLDARKEYHTPVVNAAPKRWKEHGKGISIIPFARLSSVYETNLISY
jgi:hypothetical protein